MPEPQLRKTVTKRRAEESGAPVSVFKFVAARYFFAGRPMPAKPTRPKRSRTAEPGSGVEADEGTKLSRRTLAMIEEIVMKRN